MPTNLLERRVRFGDTTCGPCLHFATVFDWIICAVEELGVELSQPIAQAIDRGAIPYGPVAVTARMDRYPTYWERVSIAGVPVAIGDRSFQIEYTLTASTGDRLGRVRVVHVSVGPEGRPEHIPDALREQLKRLRDEPRDDTLLDQLENASVEFDPSGETFSMAKTFRSPHIEAVDLGYFEDYARSMAIAMEEHLEATGTSLGSMYEKTGVVPFQPREWTFEFNTMVHLEDELVVRGRVESTSQRSVQVAYAFDGDSTADRRISGRIAYGCCNREGSFITAPEEMIGGVRQER